MTELVQARADVPLRWAFSAVPGASGGYWVFVLQIVCGWLTKKTRVWWRMSVKFSKDQKSQDKRIIFPRCPCSLELIVTLWEFQPMLEVIFLVPFDL